MNAPRARVVVGGMCWVTVVLFAALSAALTACGSERTVYVKRGAGMLGLEGNVGEERTLPDGTRVVTVGELPSDASSAPSGGIKFIEAKDPAPAWTGGPMSASAVHVAHPGAPKAPEPELFEPRKELGGNRIQYRALMPEHVLSNLIECLRQREYKPFFEQMLSDEARASYESAGGEKVFEEWAETNREALLAFLNRMGNSWAGAEVIPQQVSKMKLRYSLDKREIPGIRFTFIEISMEHGGCRLAMVR
jgi:hypothetical protein